MIRLRHNKSASESPAVLALIKEAMTSEDGKDWLRTMGYVRVKVPWSAVTWSIRDGKPYMPPAIQKGIDATPPNERYENLYIVTHREVDDGVLEPVAIRGLYEPGSMKRILVGGTGAAAWNTIRHELMHFTQEVGTMLIERGEGRKGGGHLSVRFKYGAPKKKLRAYRTDYARDMDASTHESHDIEYHPDVLSQALDMARHAKVRSPKEAAERLMGSPEHSRLTLSRYRAMKFAVFQKWMQEVGMSPTITPEIRAILMTDLPPEEEEEDDREIEPIAPARTIRLEGREWRIYAGTKYTGKYALSKEKAESIMARIKA